jgi:phosphopantetheinyl transferase
MEAALGPEERERLARIKNLQRRRQFLFSRQLLRKALSQELGLDPASLRFSAHEGEAPRLLHTRQPLYISLSHSAEMAACLMSSAPCGVDIEDITQERDCSAIAQAAFSPAFQARYLESPKPETFYELWTEMEARFKAQAPCAWLGRLSIKSYRLAMALSLTGIENLVIL